MSNFYHFLEIYFFFFNKIFVKRNFGIERVIVRWRFFFPFRKKQNLGKHEDGIVQEYFYGGILKGISNIE